MSSQVGENEHPVPSLANDLQEEWNIIERDVERYIHIPDFITFNARQVMRLALEGNEDNYIPIIMNSMVTNIRRSGSYTSTFYFGGRSLYPEKLSGKAELKIEDIVSWFKPAESLSLLIFVYFNRYLEMRSIENGWGRLNPLFRDDVALGRRIGEVWPDITPGRGMLMAGMRRIAQGFMILAYPKYLKRFEDLGMFNSTYSSVKKEIELCGFSHLTMASYLCQTCGLGVSAAASFIDVESLLEIDRRDEINWRDIHLILSQLKKRMSAKEIDKKVDFAANDKLKTLDQYIDKIEKSNGVYSWLNSSKDDLRHIVDHKITDL